MTKHHLPIKRSLQCQSVILILITCFLYLLHSPLASFSVFLGASTCVLPNACFYHMFFKGGKVRPARIVMNSFLVGELIKIFFTVILFTCALKWAKLLALPFFMAFVVMQLLNWGCTMYFISKGKQAK